MISIAQQGYYNTGTCADAPQSWQVRDLVVFHLYQFGSLPQNPASASILAVQCSATERWPVFFTRACLVEEILHPSESTCIAALVDRTFADVRSLTLQEKC